MANPDAPVLILGAGINGCALARDLVLNGVPVMIVDRNDIAFGATSRSSRLIHGGVRYLEYGEFRLVRESLQERSRLLSLAPQFVRPLRLHIPLSTRCGGLLYSVVRFLSATRTPGFNRLLLKAAKHSERGVWLVRAGLWLYDWFTRKAGVGRHRCVRVPHSDVPPVDPRKYKWVCSYIDAQVCAAERLVIAMLEDARRIAAEQDLVFRVRTWSQVKFESGFATVLRDGRPVVDAFRPPLVVNATGAWGDLTFQELNLAAPPVFGGTKGSHILTWQTRLRRAISGSGIYAEVEDGRMVFVLPFGESTLIGTTDERFGKRPEEAVASASEIDYLIRMVNAVLPDVNLQVSDIDQHYSGVRPLPYQTGDSTAAISRDHSVRTDVFDGVTFLTLVGGKLTTCRAFAELAADRVLEVLGRHRTASTENLAFAGGENYPPNRDGVDQAIAAMAAETGWSDRQVEAVWQLCGNRAGDILRQCGASSSDNLPGTQLPLAFVRWVIENEWVETPGDLIERRLLLVYNPLTYECLRCVAECLADTGRLRPEDIESEVDKAIAELGFRYGKRVEHNAALA